MQETYRKIMNYKEVLVYPEEAGLSDVAIDFISRFCPFGEVCSDLSQAPCGKGGTNGSGRHDGPSVF